MDMNFEKLATRPSAGRLASKDIAFLFLISGLVTPILMMVVVLFIAQNDTGENELMVPILTIVAIFDAAFGLGFYYYRWRFFSNFLTAASEAPGVVTFVSPVGQQRSLEYRYAYLGKDYNVANKYGSLSSKRSKLKADDKITVLLNPEKPSESLILDIYV